MSRLIGTVAGLLVVVVALPTVAEWSQAAVPVLLSVLVLLGIVRLALPPSRRRQ